MQKKYLVIALILYILSAGISYTASASLIGQSPQHQESGQSEVPSGETELGLLLDIDPNAPRNQECPVSGKMFTAVEKDAWEQRRPLFVMIENSPDARPQSGMSRADVVFEAVAEAGVTRFGAVYYCDAQRKDVVIAPVRSARTYFLDWASGFNFPMYAHVGGANLPGPTDALGQIRQYGWSLQNDIDQFSVGYPTFVRNNSRIPGRQVATEHTVETSTERLWELSEKRNWTNTDPKGNEWLDGYTQWTFEDAPENPGNVTDISYNFWSGYSQYAVSWEYDADRNAYLRTMGGEEHTDHENGEPVAAGTVVVLKTVEKGPLNELKHLLYDTVGTGTALIFKYGEVVEANWSKPTRTSQISFTDNQGNPVSLARGMIWFSVLGLGNDVVY